jgi:plasmid stabilization system protein ParE
MVVIWTPNAEKRLDEIYCFYEAKSKQVARKLIADLRNATQVLVAFPYMAMIESNLTGNRETYRSLVVRRFFKVIYYVENDTVYIFTVWDCRQNPGKMREDIKQF